MYALDAYDHKINWIFDLATSAPDIYSEGSTIRFQPYI